MVTCFENLSEDKECRCIVLTGAGKGFTGGLLNHSTAGLGRDHLCFVTVGLDLADFAGLLNNEGDDDVSRKAFQLRKTILSMQNSFNVIEKVRNKKII